MRIRRKPWARPELEACDFCVKCDYNQMRRIEWGVCGSRPNPSDWLLEDLVPNYRYRLKVK